MGSKYETSVISSEGRFIFWHDQSADDVKDDGRTRKQREEEKSDSQQGGIDAEVLGKTAENTEEPTVLGRFGQWFFTVHVRFTSLFIVFIIRKIN